MCMYIFNIDLPDEASKGQTENVPKIAPDPGSCIFENCILGQLFPCSKSSLPSA